MNKIKKSFALALALLMALSVMAFPAAACEDEGIMPLAPWGYCPRCSSTAPISTEYWTGTIRTGAACGGSVKAHNHEIEYGRNVFECSACGTVRGSTFKVSEYCTISGIYV